LQRDGGAPRLEHGALSRRSELHFSAFPEKSDTTMKRVSCRNEVYAFVLSSDDFQPGAKFISEADWPLQVGLMTLPSGHTIGAHAHLLQSSPQIQPTQEFLLVISGKMEVDFFDEDGQHFHTEILPKGGALLQIRGGHAFRFLEATRLIEVKSGPYLGREKDKVLLEVDNSVSSLCSGEPGERTSP
jgi:hypothetical protein